MRKVLLFGTSVFSKELFNYIRYETKDILVLGFVMDRDYIDKDLFCGLNIYPFEELDECLETNDFEIIPSLGYSKMNTNRMSLFERCHQKNYKIGSYVSPTTVLHSSQLGEGNIIFGNVTIEFDSSVGNGNIILANAYISHDMIIGDYNYISGDAMFGGAVQVGNNNFFGMNCTIKDNLRIGNKNLVGAMAYVSSDLENNTMVSAPRSQKRALSDNMLDTLL